MMYLGHILLIICYSIVDKRNTYHLCNKKITTVSQQPSETFSMTRRKDATLNYGQQDTQSKDLLLEDDLRPKNPKYLPTTSIFHQIKKWLPRLFFVLLLVTLVDLFIFYKNFTLPKLHQFEIFLEPTRDSPNSEATVLVQGKMQKSSLTVALDSRGAVCNFFYRTTAAVKYQALTELQIEFPIISNTINAFDIRSNFVELDFSLLRQVYFDLTNHTTISSHVKVTCAIELQAVLWQVLPFYKTLHGQHELPLNPIRKRVVKEKSEVTFPKHNIVVEQEKDNKPKDKDEPIQVQASLKHVSINAIRYEIMMRLNKNFRPYRFIEILILHVPKISYATALVDKVGHPKSYFRLEIEAFTVNFAHVPALVDIDVNVECSPYKVYEGNVGIDSTSSGDCTLLSPFDLRRMKFEYQHNGFVNITSHATQLNFITKFVGANHYIRSIPAKDIGHADHIRALATLYQQHQQSPTENRKLLATTTDPTISTGSDCIGVDTDGIYFSQTCSVIEKGFFKLGVNTFSSEGYLGYLQSTTSWSPPKQKVAFQSELIGSQTNLGDIAMNLFFSDNFHNLTFFTFLNYTKTGTILTESLDCNWDIHRRYGDIRVNSLTTFDAYAPLFVMGDLEYGNAHYNATVKVGDGFNVTAATSTANVSGDGRYGGDWYDWWATLDESSYYHNRKYEGGAIGAVSYHVPSSGTTGEIKFAATATDNVHQDYLITNFSGGWYKDTSWAADGTIYADLFVDIVPKSILVNITSGFHYGSHAYLLDVNFGLNQEPQYVVVYAAGGYGGAKSDFHVELDNSTLIFNGDLIGHVVAALQFHEANYGSIVGLAGTSLVLNGSNVEVFQSASNVTWFTTSKWDYNGNINADVYFKVVPKELVVNSTSGFHYGNHSYLLDVNVGVNQEPQYVVVYAAGGYGGSKSGFHTEWYHSTRQSNSTSSPGKPRSNFHVELDNSTLIFNGDLIGHVVAALQFHEANYGSIVGLAGTSLVLNGSNVEVFQSASNVTWFTTSKWDYNGNIYADVYFKVVPKELVVNSTSGFHYGSHAYLLDVNVGVNNETQYVVVYAAGGYGGAKSDFHVELDNSTLIFNGDLIGHMVAALQFHEANYGSIVGVAGNARVVNGSNVEVFKSASNVTWFTTSKWDYNGNIGLTSIVNINQGDGLNWNVTTWFQYADDIYTLYVYANNVDATTAGLLVCSAVGTYDIQKYNWTVVVTAATCASNGSDLGFVAASTNIFTKRKAQNFFLTYQLNALDGDRSPVLTSQQRIQAYSDPSINYGNRKRSPWVFTGHVEVDSFWNLTNTLMFNASVQLEYANHSYQVYLVDAHQYKNNSVIPLYSYGKGGYQGSPFSTWVVTLNESLLMYDDKLIGSATGAVSGLFQSNGRLNLTATVLNAQKYVTVQTTEQVTWDSDTSYNVQGAFGLLSQMLINDTLSWNVSTQAEYGHHNYTVSFYDHNHAYDGNADDDDVIIVSYATGQYRGSSLQDWYVSVDQGFVSVDGDLKANVKAAITVDIATNGTVGTLGLQFVDYGTWQYYPQAQAYYINESIFGTNNWIQYKYDKEVFGGQFMTTVQYDSAPLFSLSTELQGNLQEDVATFTVVETLYGKEGLNLLGSAKYNLETGMLAAIEATIYYEEDLVYGFNSKYDLQLESYVIPSHLPTSMPSVQPSSQPVCQPTSCPTTHPSRQPTNIPSALPSTQPSTLPTSQPSLQPASHPSVQPSSLPTVQPFSYPTTQPSRLPSTQPSNIPSRQPSTQPSAQPLANPSTQPSRLPSTQPSNVPSRQPSTQPSTQPNPVPSTQPSRQPSTNPSSKPSEKPSTSPTSQPSGQPTRKPSAQPSAVPTTTPSAHPTALRYCPAGQYLVKKAQVQECFDCPEGFAAAPGANTCTQCTAGYYAEAAVNASSCIPCPLNTYQPGNGKTTCIACGAGYITGSTASVLKSSCVNPTSSVIAGFIFSFVGMVIIWAYVYRGRLLRIAFTRKERLVKKLIIIAGAVSRSIDFLSATNQAINLIIKETNQDKAWWTKERWEHIKMVLFVLFTIVVMFVVVLSTLSVGISGVLFNAMMMYRSYNMYLIDPEPFREMLQSIVNLVLEIAGMAYLRVLTYPFVYVVGAISDIHLDLTAVQVSCAGAQAPGLLLVNLLIVGVVIIIIRSDIQVYWETAQHRVLFKAICLPFNNNYASKHTTWTCVSVLFAMVMFCIPTPCKVIQYSMSFVTITKFFTQDGRSASNANCDLAFSIPFDTILAIVTTLFVYIVLSPVIYMLAQVIIPSFKLGVHRFPLWSLLRQYCGVVARNLRTTTPSLLASMTKKTDAAATNSTTAAAASPMRRTNSTSSTKNGNIELQDIVHPNNNPSIDRTSIQEVLEDYFDKKQFEEAQRSITTSTDHNHNHSNSISSISISSRSVSTASTITMTTFAADARWWKPIRTLCSDVTRFISMLFALDWFLFKFISVIIVAMFDSFRAFLMLDHVAEEVVTSGPQHKYDQDYAKLQTVRIEISTATLPHIPWLLFWKDAFLTEAEQHLESKEEKRLWSKEKGRFPNFVKTSMTIRNVWHAQLISNAAQLNNNNNSKQAAQSCQTRIVQFIRYMVYQCVLWWCCYPASYIVVFQLTTDIGRVVWLRVLQNYLSVFALSCGCWLEYMVDEFNILADYKRFRNNYTLVERDMEETAQRYSSSVRLTMLTIGTALEAMWEAKMSATNTEETDREAVMDYHHNYNDDDEAEAEEAEAKQSAIWTDDAEMQSSSSSKRAFFNIQGGALARVTNDPTMLFMEYVAAIVKVRVVLLQIIPAFTVWSIIAVDLANCPVLVFSQDMLNSLPPLWVTQSIVTAETMLMEDAKEAGETSVETWKVYSLAAYIFTVRSRALKFVFTLINTIGSFVIVFGRGSNTTIRAVLTIVIIEFFLLGIVYGLYLTMLLHRYMFPPKREEKGNGDVRKRERSIADEFHHDDSEKVDVQNPLQIIKHDKEK